MITAVLVEKSWMFLWNKFSSKKNVDFTDLNDGTHFHKQKQNLSAWRAFARILRPI